MTSQNKKSFIDNLIDVKHKLFTKEIDAFTWNFGKQADPFNINNINTGTQSNMFLAQEDDDPNAPIFPEWYFSLPFGQPRRVDIQKVRTFARSPWVKMCISTIVKSVLRTNWDIVNKDPEDKTNYESQIKKVKDFFANPNQEKETWDAIVTQYIYDLLEIDSGVMYLRRAPTQSRELLELYAADGGSFLQDIDIHRHLRAFWQYTWKNPITAPKKYEPDEVMYSMMNKSSYRLYGWSPLMSVMQVVEVMMQALRYNREFFINNAMPDGLISIEQASKDSFRQAKNQWEREFRGKPHRMMFVNGKVDYQQMTVSNRDMEWLEGQKWYMHMIFGAFGLSPESVGYSDGINRAEGKNQSNNTDINSLLPYLNYLEKQFSEYLIPAILGEENKPFFQRTPLVYKYFPIGTSEEQLEFNNDLELVKNKLLTANEFRRKRGFEPFDNDQADDPFNMGFDMPGINTDAPKFEEGSNSDKLDNNSDKPQKMAKTKIVEEEEEQDEEEETKSAELPPVLEDNVENYSDLFNKTLDSWEKQILKSLHLVQLTNKSIDQDKSLKTFGSFVRTVTETINTSRFVKALRGVITNSVMDGVKQAEVELNLDIGKTEPIDRKIDQLYDQQFNGYTINGKKWFGIKGTSNDLQLKIFDSIKEGVTNREDLKQLKTRIESIFDTVKSSNAMRIARTESNRFQNQGKLIGFKESGVSGKKVWKSYVDDDTSPICKRLNDQVKELSEDFDDGVEWQGLTPPSHPNCRSRIEFIPDDGDR